MKKFIYITGSSGSGSNILAKVLSKLDTVLGVGETHINFDHFTDIKFNEANRFAWDRHADFEQHDYHIERLKEILKTFEKIKSVEDTTHIVFKRSIMNGDRYRSDIKDLLEHYPEAKVLIMFRKPEASSYSSFRRRLGENLRHCSILQDEQLTLLSKNVSELPKEKCMVISYSKFCLNPNNYATKISDFCELPLDDIKNSISNIEIDKSKIDRWAVSVGAEKAARLSKFFLPRISHWSDILKREIESRP